MNGRARFDEQQNLRWFLDRGKTPNWLLDSVVEYPKILAMEAFDEVPAVVGYDHSHIDAFNVDLNCLLRRLRIFLRRCERTQTDRGR